MSYKPFQYLMCSSAGFPSTNAQTKLPITQQVGDSLFNVASDAITVNGDGVYSISGIVQIQSAAQRLQATVKIFINGVYDGIERGGSYIRNAGTSYAFWGVNFYTVKTLSKNDTIEFYVTNVQGSSYGGGGTANYSVNSSGNEIIIERR